MKRSLNLKFKLLACTLGCLMLGAFAQEVRAAACCGGGFAAPAVIVGDDKAQLTGSYAFTQLAVDNVDSKGIWRTSDTHQQIQTLRLEGAHLISDRWQVGAILPVIQRAYLGQDYSGLGDVATSLGYEYLPDWDYNPIRPKGIGFLQLTLPTGKARAESEVGGLDSRGNGFLSIGVGTILTKSWAAWDAFSSLEAHRSFSKDVHSSQVSGRLNPGYGGNLGVGAGYNTAWWRFGGAITWTYEDPVKLDGTSPSAGSVERYATAALSASYMASLEWAGTLSYADQTVFGNPVNTSLGRSVSLQLQRRWGR